MSATEFPNLSLLLFLCSFVKVLERLRSWYCLLFSAGIRPRQGRMSNPETFVTWVSALVAFIVQNSFGREPPCLRGHQPQVHPEKGYPLSSNPANLLIIGHSQMLSRTGRLASCYSSTFIIGSAAPPAPAPVMQSSAAPKASLLSTLSPSLMLLLLLPLWGGSPWSSFP